MSGAQLYGFPSPDSDYDLRGAHIWPLNEVVGLLPRQETVEVEGLRGDIEMDLVTHDILKFFNLLLKPNGYVLEQLFAADRADELLARGTQRPRPRLHHTASPPLEEYRLPNIAELVDRKINGAEKGTLPGPEMDFHRGEYERLVEQVAEEAANSKLRGAPTCRETMNDCLVRVRLKG